LVVVAVVVVLLKMEQHQARPAVRVVAVLTAAALVVLRHRGKVLRVAQVQRMLEPAAAVVEQVLQVQLDKMAHLLVQETAAMD
jgi:hypothetical protein